MPLNPEPMNLVFMGTSHFAAAILGALAADRRFSLQAVYAQAGRRSKPGVVALLAQTLGLGRPRAPASLADEAGFLRSLQPDAGVVADYGRLVPQALLRLPRHGFINAHPSLLPRWRGAAPVERAIMAGDSHTGVCIMRMTEALDEGDIFACQRTAIGAGETAGELRQRLAGIAAAAMLDILERLQAGRAQAQPQAQAGICYAPKLQAAETRLDWRLSAETLERRIRACTPAPGAWFEAPAGTGRGSAKRESVRIGVSRARAIAWNAASAPPGAVLDDTPHIACAAGSALQLLQLQREGRKSMAADAFLRGFPLPPGLRLPVPQAEASPCRATG